ncbi:hypothetical protein [Cupriavidus alkaliphilus]|uniref:hypothetical protein n=1 Tax=Cupriavidus alkaliphilus TaxID=942866 RepID=UPI00160FBBC2|nr:hypothetical protein [Cupriavidus alkaliphilus]MBB2918314.1 hypothetical protein [Cupriavidus alkaliphilus]
MREGFEADFAEWWRTHGQYLRAGGGQYEIAFAYEAAKYFCAAGMERAAQICEQAYDPEAKPVEALGCAAAIRAEISSGMALNEGERD